MTAALRKSNTKFVPGQYVVYPMNGVGKILSLEKNIIAGSELEFYIIRFDHSKMTLRLPLHNVQKSGLRKLSTKVDLQVALKALKEKKRKSKGLWSHKASEYETKINSGDLVKIAEVLRDLAGTNTAESTELSFSERNLFQEALTRMAWELACIEKIDVKKAQEKILKFVKF